MIIKNQAKKISSLFFFAVILSCSIFNLTANAQDVTEASSYYLPKTAIDFTILIEKTTCEPGDLNMYAERFLKKDESPRSMAFAALRGLPASQPWRRRRVRRRRWCR